jgi:hypothetical protein
LGRSGMSSFLYHDWWPIGKYPSLTPIFPPVTTIYSPVSTSPTTEPLPHFLFSSSLQAGRLIRLFLPSPHAQHLFSERENGPYTQSPPLDQFRFSFFLYSSMPPTQRAGKADPYSAKRRGNNRSCLHLLPPSDRSTPFVDNSKICIGATVSASIPPAVKVSRKHARTEWPRHSPVNLIHDRPLWRCVFLKISLKIF